MVDHVVNLNELIPHLAERLFCRNLYVALPLDRCVYCVEMVKCCIPNNYSAAIDSDG